MFKVVCYADILEKDDMELSYYIKYLITNYQDMQCLACSVYRNMRDPWRTISQFLPL